MDDLTRFKKLKEIVESAQRKRNMAEGKLEGISKTLKGLGYATFKDAVTAHKKLVEKEESLTRQLELDIEEFNNAFSDLLTP